MEQDGAFQGERGFPECSTGVLLCEEQGMLLFCFNWNGFAELFRFYFDLGHKWALPCLWDPLQDKEETVSRD